jgi:hypothetical protein
MPGAWRATELTKKGRPEEPDGRKSGRNALDVRAAAIFAEGETDETARQA